MKARLPVLLMLGGMIAFNLCAEQHGQPNQRHPTAPEARGPVLVELFTSEGCSSCPSADALLARLEASQEIAEAEIIALKQHVDYWNRLGWADPFSSAAFTERQSEYGQFFGHGSVYTPQMVVDGQEELVGSDERKARKAIERAVRAPKARIELQLLAESAPREVRLRIRIAELSSLTPGDTPEVFLAVTEGNLSSHVTRGENAGRRLVHAAVVRELKRIAQIEPRQEFTGLLEVPVRDGWKIENLRAVVFVQERRSRRVQGAAQIRLAG